MTDKDRSLLMISSPQLMLPKSDSSNTLAHFGGLGALIKMYSPEVFSSGDLHVIFVGCRPVLVSKINRQPPSMF